MASEQGYILCGDSVGRISGFSRTMESKFERIKEPVFILHEAMMLSISPPSPHNQDNG